ncbi:MAG: glycine--tRNA ligase [Candidatus Omnitrophica bacterium]|nr:glycine--tRNA ligase [Candidatus Omnitrophota bacterium]MDD5574768.1 glycine--tRNA ligase [Candidatus Omnitrophota bacterium]
MDKIVSLCKRRGFIFQSSEIYGGLANTWDYGPFGVELKNNLKRAWWASNVYQRDDIYGMDAAILMNPKTWEASGHLQSFADPFVKCPSCSNFFKFDKIWDDILWNSPWCNSLKKVWGGINTKILQKWAESEGKKIAPNLALVKEPQKTLSNINDDELKSFQVIDSKFIGLIAASQIPCPSCGHALPENSMPANLMLETYFGPVRETAQKVYFRPETAQGMFVNFTNILDSRHPKLPFGLAQIGKSFRNEITPGNFIFRTREFEQMEIEYFVRPEESDAKLKEWIEARYQWYIGLGMNKEHLRIRPHGKEELAHYAKACSDIEYEFPFGWSELEGIANRTDFDLKQHASFSGKEMTYYDDAGKQRFYPYIIEPSGGVDRSVLAFLVDAYHEEIVRDEKRVVLRLSKELAPIKAAVLPLLRNRPEIVGLAKELARSLKKDIVAAYDDTGAIGKLYRRQDEVGTLYCVTVDVQSLEDKKVTVRDRDTMQQERIDIAQLKNYLKEKLN